MFFALSKIVGFFALPSNVLFVLAIIGVALIGTQLARWGRRIVIFSILLIGVAGLSPLGIALWLPLEQRFPPWAGADNPTGIVVLGGAIDPLISAERGTPALNESAERLTVVADLARRFSQGADRVRRR